MEREGALLAHYPLLIQKTLADKLSDKVQVIIAPTPAAGEFIGSNLVGARAPAGAATVISRARRASLAIVVQDHAALRAAPRSGATELTSLWQGEVLEVRGERAGYLSVYDYRRERGGYLKSEAVRTVGLGAADAPQLLAVLRFLRDSPGWEALGISYGAAYLKAVPANELTAEPFDAIASMAERLADQASGSAPHPADSPRTSTWSDSSACTCAASSARVACRCATTASCIAACSALPRAHSRRACAGSSRPDTRSSASTRAQPRCCALRSISSVRAA